MSASDFISLALVINIQAVGVIALRRNCTDSFVQDKPDTAAAGCM